MLNLRNTYWTWICKLFDYISICSKPDSLTMPVIETAIVSSTVTPDPDNLFTALLEPVTVSFSHSVSCKQFIILSFVIFDSEYDCYVVIYGLFDLKWRYIQ